MDRKIKFRALAEHNNGEKEWFYYTIKTGKILVDMYVNGKIKRWIVEDLQYTGLWDKEGQEIFESDIVKYGECIGVIEFKFGKWLIVNKKDGLKNNSLFEWIVDTKNQIEVIGNIYEPEGKKHKAVIK